MGQESDAQDDRLPRGDEPGAASTPADEGAGVVGLDSRTGDGSPAANQGKAEHLSAAEGDDAAQPPDLESMNVGAGDPQTPSHANAGVAADRAGGGLPSLDGPVLGGSVDGTAVEDLGAPTSGRSGGRSDGRGRAFRSPGSHGEGGDLEQIDTDLAASADRQRTGPPTAGVTAPESGTGDAATVPVVSDDASRGTSEESGVVEGIRTPR